jgi:hypothetical protein
MSGRHHSIVGTGPLSSANPLPPPPSVHPPSLSHGQPHPHGSYHPHHQSPASINAKAQSRPPTGRSPMMRGAAAGNGGPAGGPSAEERERDAYYRSEAYARDRDVARERDKALHARERERERERDMDRERDRDRQIERERERERGERTRERDRDRARERDHVARSQQQQHINGHGPPPYHQVPNGQYPPGPTTRHPLDINHGHPSSHLPPPPQPSGPSSAMDRRESRIHPAAGPPPPHHHHHQVPNPRTSSLGPNLPGPPGGPAGLTAAQVHTAIVKGTEGPLQALAQANEQTWLLIGKLRRTCASYWVFLILYNHLLAKLQVLYRNNCRIRPELWSPTKTPCVTIL